MNTLAATAITGTLALMLSVHTAFAQSTSNPPMNAVARTVAADSEPASGTAAPVRSEEPSEWKFRFTPYFLLGAMDGHTTIKGRTSEVNQDLSDVVNLIDNYLNFGAAFHFEAEKGRWGMLADVSYMDLQAVHQSAVGNRILEASLQQFIGELGAFYTIVPLKPMSDGFPTIRLDALAGLRVTWLQMEIDPTAIGSTKGDKSWVDPFFGARVYAGFNDWLTARLRGDIGGFDLIPGTTSKLAWQVDASLCFRLSSVIDLEAGYRWLGQDYEDGSGANRFVYDIVINGPYLGLTFKF